MWSTTLILFVGLLYPLVHPASSQDIFYYSCVNPFKQAGICISIKKCPLLLKILTLNRQETIDFLRASNCGYNGRDPLVCCPTDTEEVSFTEAPRSNNEVQNNTYGPLLPPDCGFSNAEHDRIVGGVPAHLGAWPWITALGYVNQREPSRPKWLCGGTLISKRHIVTAGHCVYRREDLYVVRIGDLDLNSDRDGAQPFQVLIEKKVVHPQYSPKTYTNDIAVLRVQQDVPFSRNLHPICLPVTNEIRNRDLDGTNPFVAGWGSVYFRGPSSSRLMELQIPVVPTSRCQRAFQNFGNAIIDDRVICAGFEVGGKDACQGDSGGPMMSPRKSTFYLVGVVSYGYRCAEPGYPGVYTKVTAFLDFIIDQLV